VTKKLQRVQNNPARVVLQDDSMPSRCYTGCRWIKGSCTSQQWPHLNTSLPQSSLTDSQLHAGPSVFWHSLL